MTLRQLVLAALVATSCVSAFAPSFGQRPALVASRFALRMSDQQQPYNSVEGEDSEEGEYYNEEAEYAEEQTMEMVVPQTNLQPIPQSQKEMDPLVRSLTRMDGDAAGAQSVSVPLLGEISEKELVLIPVAAFAVIGFLFAIYIGLTSSDAFVALEDAATKGKQSPTPVQINAEGCRGICSSQEKDLEGLRQFMNNFAK